MCLCSTAALLQTVELHGTHVRLHCHQFAGFDFVVKSVALQQVDHLPCLADALHVSCTAAPAPVFTADFSLCSWRFVNLSHKLLQSLAATWTCRLAARRVRWLYSADPGYQPNIYLHLFWFFLVFLQMQEREAKMPFTENLDSSNSLLAHFSPPPPPPPPEYLYSQSEPAVVSWDWHADLYVKLLDSFCVLLKHHFLLLFVYY